MRSTTRLGGEMHTNLEARAGRRSAAHWKTATFGWFPLVVAAVAVGTVVGGKQLTDAENANGEAARAEHILAHAGFANVATESVLVQSTGAARPDAVTRDVSAMLRARTDVKDVKAPVRSKDGRSLLVQFDLRGDGATADQRVQPVLDAVATVQNAHPGFVVEELGGASADHALNATIGNGAMIVVSVSMIGSLTVLPALLSKRGDRLEWGRLRRRKRTRRDSRVWAALLKPSLRHPAIAAVLSTAFLVALALPAFGMHTKLLSPNDLPRGLKIVQTYHAVQKAFPGSSSPATVVYSAADVTAPRVQREIATPKIRALASGRMKKPIRTSINPAHTVEKVDIPLVGNANDAASMHAPSVLRGLTTSPVTGETAGDGDFNTTNRTHAPLVFAFVLGLAFLLLLLTFRSIVIPIKAIGLNLLSVGAAYGVLVWIFQDGHMQSLLGFHSNGAIVTWLPLFLFTVLFRLSMDYHVFILSRIKELVDGGMRTEEAVEKGIRTTAGTVTSAALVMVAVFAIFASLSVLDMKQMGVGLAVAVLLDATIVRAVLLPATMKLLGRWNWYLPRSLHWLPRMHGPSVA